MQMSQELGYTSRDRRRLRNRGPFHGFARNRSGQHNTTVLGRRPGVAPHHCILIYVSWAPCFWAEGKRPATPVAAIPSPPVWMVNRRSQLNRERHSARSRAHFSRYYTVVRQFPCEQG